MLFLLLSAALGAEPAPLSPEAAAWQAEARRQISSRWSFCLENLPSSVPLPEPSYTTVSELDVNADGTPASVKIVRSSGSEALDACALQAAKGTGKFPAPPASLVGATGTAHLPEVVLTVDLGRSAPPPPPTGKPVEATRVAGVTASAVAAAPTKIASAMDGERNIWCGGAGAALACSIRDRRGSMLVFSVTVCHRDADLHFGTAYGPMFVRGASDLLPDVAACK